MKMLETTTQLVGNHHPFEKHLRQNGFESSESCGVKTKKTVEANWILSGELVGKKNRASQPGSLLVINGVIYTPYKWLCTWVTITGVITSPEMELFHPTSPLTVFWGQFFRHRVHDLFLAQVSHVEISFWIFVCSDFRPFLPRDTCKKYIYCHNRSCATS